ncbi:hypothetical protein NADFUDRAFT_83643, partial [Nadsonia fulvescens var. elongata DSM 6958]
MNVTDSPIEKSIEVEEKISSESKLIPLNSSITVLVSKSEEAYTIPDQQPLSQQSVEENKLQEQEYRPWSLYLQRAVANVEQTLDKVLQESSDSTDPVVKSTPALKLVDSPTIDVSLSSPLPVSVPSNVSSSPKINSTPVVATKKRLTMQERLAMAVKAGKSGKGNKNRVVSNPTTPDNGDTSRVTSPSLDISSELVKHTDKSSVEIAHGIETQNGDHVENRSDVVTELLSTAVSQETPVNLMKLTDESAQVNVADGEILNSSTGKALTQSNSSSTLEPTGFVASTTSVNESVDASEALTQSNSSSTLEPAGFVPSTTNVNEFVNASEILHTREELELLVGQTQSDLSAQESRYQSEIYAANEKIDALEKKLKFLAQQEAERAHKQINKSSGFEKKMAEKEEMIALLMEEGQALSKKELTHMNTIKKLRQEERENQRFYQNYKQKLEVSELERLEWKEKARRFGEIDKQLADKSKRFTKLENDYENIRTECEQFKDKYNQLKEANLEEETRVQNERIQAEHAKVEDLQNKLDDLSASYESDKSLMEKQIKDLTDDLRRQKEAFKVVESDLRTDLQTQEFRVEYYRAKAEELSSNLGGGDNHAKYLRKIETLQSQHEAALENWNTLEHSFNTKILRLETNLEESKISEDDLKKKLKSLSLKHRSVLEKNQGLSDKIQNLEFDAVTWQNKAFSLQSTISSCEEIIKTLELDLSDQEKKYTSTIEKLEDERNKAIKDLQNTPALPSPYRGPDSMSFGPWGGSPYISNSRKVSLTGEFGVDTSFSSSGRASMGHMSPISSFFDVQSMGTALSSKRTFTHPEFEEGQDNQDNVSETHSESGSVGNLGQRSKLRDSASASTVGGNNGGPSIQLVGKMSTMIRKLEADLAGVRNELMRTAKAKDEACDEVLKLIEENQHFKEISAKSHELE